MSCPVLRSGVSPEVLRVLTESIVWDNHACMPLRTQDASFLPQLSRFRAAGVDVVSLNVGFDALPWQDTLAVCAAFRRWLRAHGDEYALVQGVADIARARAENKLAVMFDIEGGNALNGELGLIETYYELGVRWMLIAYNLNNALGGGCNDDDTGLTAFGRRVVEEMARVGMVTCCSHTGYRTARDVMEHSPNPVILSHSNPAGVWRHYRNVSDEAIRACAATGGVVGINGIGPFLGEYDSSTQAIVRHIDYVAELVGVEHVGIALDYVFDQTELQEYLRNNPRIFPQESAAHAMDMVTPEQIPLIAEQLSRLGYTSGDLRAVLGGNHLRVANRVWR